MWKRKIIVDICFLALFPIISSLATILFKLNYFQSLLLFFGLPSIYLSFRTKIAIKRSFIFAILWSLPSGLVIDFLAGVNKVWEVPNSVFPRIFGFIPVEDLLWGFLISYLVVIFYEHFDDKCKVSKVGRGKIENLILYGVAILAVFVVIFFVKPVLFNIPYFYLLGGLVFIVLPLIMFYIHFSSTVGKFYNTGIYLLSIALLHEFSGLKTFQWTFPSGQYIGWVSFMGVRFPLEEFIYFFFLLTPAILSYYEFLADNQR